MKLKALFVAVAVTLVGCGEPIDKRPFNGTVLNGSCSGDTCYLVVSRLDKYYVRRHREYPTCEDYRALIGKQVMVFARAVDNKICWVAYEGHP